MYPMPIFPRITEIKAALAAVGIVGRSLLLVTTHRTETRTHTRASSGYPTSQANQPQHQEPSTRAWTRALTAAVTAAQLTNAALTIVDWLHSAGLV